MQVGGYQGSHSRTDAHEIHKSMRAQFQVLVCASTYSMLHLRTISSACTYMHTQLYPQLYSLYYFYEKGF